jgi:uncharacterized protein YbjT (DUF2867 family)
MNPHAEILVTGATGYVGGRLVPQLLEKGYPVRVLARDPERLSGRSWSDSVAVHRGDVLEMDSLLPAMAGVESAYYLIHSMMAGSGFHERDQRAAINFSRAAQQAGVRRIIYLGGLGDPVTDLSQHLRSRHETGQALQSAGVPLIEFRAGVIVGAGSISFEMIRYLTERVPVMISPRWVFTRTQPISIRNTIEYLVAALDFHADGHEIIEIGGPRVLSYGDMLRGYAQVRGLRRAIVPVPVLTPRLSSYWVHWVTPIPASIARPLIEGLRNEAVVRDDRAATLFPEIRLIQYPQAVEEALIRLERGDLESVWSDALATSQGDTPPVTLTTQEGMIIEQRSLPSNASPEALYQIFSRLGGSTGWLYADWAWRLRGVLDHLVGGVGFRRGRRDAKKLRVGDALDFWRVEHLTPGMKLRLRAEMKVPGRAWLQFEVKSKPGGGATLIQTAIFAPKGLTGLLYWYLLYPIHAWIFSGMIRAIERRARSTGDLGNPPLPRGD